MISSPAIFRQAMLDDVSAIAAVKTAVWPEEESDVGVIARALQTPTHHTHIAMVDEQVVGFVSCFTTESAQGERRWEVDLLAVHPDFRRRGLATKLIEGTLALPEAQSCEYARALIQIDNVGSQRSFAQNGFTTDGQIHTLLICSQALEAADARTSAASGCHMIPVNTLGYQGLWLEEPLSTEAFTLARAELAGTNAAVAGVIIPDDDNTNITYAEAQHYESVGKYQRWIRK